MKLASLQGVVNRRVFLPTTQFLTPTQASQKLSGGGGKEPASLKEGIHGDGAGQKGPWATTQVSRKCQTL
jgi:hypothetical protein